MTANLKPCPFCGNNEVVVLQGNLQENKKDYLYSIVCMSCYGQTGERVEKLIPYLYEDWNKRAFEEKAVEVLAERLHHITQLERIHSNYVYWKDLSEATRNEYRAEAKQLLGVK